LQKANEDRRTLCSETPFFQFATNCLFCGCAVDLSAGHRKGFEFFQVRTTELDASIKSVCAARQDEWAADVFRRLCLVSDLHAADAVYHQVCSSNFRTMKLIPSQLSGGATEPDTKKRRVGRPSDDIKYEAFLKVTSYLADNDQEQITVKHLVDKMQSFLPSDTEAYSIKYMKSKLLEHFQGEIVVTDIDGTVGVVTFRRTASSILHTYYEHQQRNSITPEEEKLRLIEAAAQLIQSDIKLVAATKQTYTLQNSIPVNETSVDDLLPLSLHTFLNSLFVGKHKRVKMMAIGQAIMQAVRPKILIAPLQLGLAVQLHHHYGSRYLIDTLHALGFC